MYLGVGGALTTTPPAEAEAFDQYLSDPNGPCPTSATCRWACSATT
jgi:hypothetical protein